VSGLSVTVGCSEPEPEPDAAFAELRSEEQHDQAPALEPGEAEALASDNHALTLDLYHALRDGQAAGEGFSISAYSIHSAFGMLLAGTVEPARSQMAAGLHFSLSDERQYFGHNWLDAELESRNLPASTDPENEQAAVDLHTANGVWVLDSLAELVAPDYLDVLAVHYDAGVYLAEFGSQPDVERLAINGWVSDRTNALIPELFVEGIITPDTTMVLVNAVYMKAPWAEPFSEDATAPAPFFGLDGVETEVDMMHAGLLEADYGAGPDYQAVAIPMRGGALELLVIVPDDFASFEADLDDATFTALRADMSGAVVDLHLPKFELEAKFELSPELKELGVVAPFVDSNSFDAILPGLGVIAAVVHQTVIKVDEKGTEAAAATGIVVGESGSPEPDTLTVDRPFLLAIRDAPTDTLLFFGRVLKP
jgi:serpin B